MVSNMVNKEPSKMSQRCIIRRRLSVLAGVVAALLECTCGGVWAEIPDVAYYNYFSQLGSQKLTSALQRTLKIDQAGHIASIEPSLIAWSHLETVVNSHRLFTDQLQLLVLPTCRSCEMGESIGASADKICDADRFGKAGACAAKGWHLLADTGYHNARFKSWTNLKVRGPMFLLGSYYANHDILCGCFVSGASQKYDAWDSELFYLGQCGRNSVLSGGIFTKWQPNAFWLASSVQLGVSRFTNSICRGYVDPLAQFAGSAYCGVGVNHALTQRLGTDLHTSYQYTYVGRGEDGDGILPEISLQIARVGGRVRYDFSGHSDGNNSAAEQNRSLAYLGVAYDRELNAKMALFDTKRLLPPHSAVIEAGCDLQHKKLSAKLSASVSLAKIKRQRFSLSLSYAL